jgi:alpha-tubulin suppressor-like RCC1 family protein
VSGKKACLSGATALLAVLTSLCACKLKLNDGAESAPGEFPCEHSETCPVADTPCLAALCLDEQCVYVPAPDGVLPQEDQSSGDCTHLYCDGEGEVWVQTAQFDAPADDGNPCTEAICDQQTPKQEPKVAGNRCGGAGICNGAGICGVCLPKDERCEGAGVVTCGSEGQWSAVRGCDVSAPRCSDARCRGISEVALGGGHGCARFEDDAVLCWGANLRGQLGSGGVRDADTAVWGGFRVVAPGSRHACAIRQSDGGVWCWGANDYGQLGNGSLTSSSPPVDTGVRGASHVVVGNNHSCALIGNGDVVCFGRNDRGQTGGGRATKVEVQAKAPRNTTSSRAHPQRIDGLSAKALVVGADFTCARTPQRVACWGHTEYDVPPSLEPSEEEKPTPEQKKALKDRLAISITSPTKVALSGARQLASGEDHNCVLLTDGSVQCWGAGRHRQHGGASDKDAFKPAVVAGITGATQIAVGDSFGCAVSGTDVMCWGNNRRGQLGNGSDTPNGSASAIANLAKTSQIFAGGSFACAMTSGRQLQCWGDNRTGQLGRAAPSLSRTPLPMTW